MKPINMSELQDICYYFSFFFLIGIYSMQGSTDTTRHGVKEKEAQKD